MQATPDELRRLLDSLNGGQSTQPIAPVAPVKQPFPHQASQPNLMAENDMGDTNSELQRLLDSLNVDVSGKIIDLTNPTGLLTNTTTGDMSMGENTGQTNQIKQVKDSTQIGEMVEGGDAGDELQRLLDSLNGDMIGDGNGVESSTPAQITPISASTELLDQNPPNQPTRTNDTNRTSQTMKDTLPIIHALANNAQFMEELSEMQSAQMNVELSLRDQRNRLVHSCARGGGGPGMGVDGALKRQLVEWDKQALFTWTNLQISQRQQLYKMGVPMFEETKDPIIIKRQEAIFKVLLALLDD